MPIAVLSDDTSRAISATLVLNDAVSVVKELLDNALDSRSTNISIEISANTLDIIQVKDNGSGLGVEDRQLLCKRNYTSKIRNIEDLAQIGGSSLGFRGEALASIAALSETVSFTTRIDGESVATALKFDSKSKLISSSSASHSSGTTVRVFDFLKYVPVRRQTALKNAQRVLESIKKLLYEYAFARPTVRLQFKILKSSSNLKHNWSYVPSNDTQNLAVIASKIVGKDIASQCKQHFIKSDDGSLSMEALLIADDCDTSKIASSARYISVDGRPIAAEYGIAKDMDKKYKLFLKSRRPELSGHAKFFMYVRISCPRGFYDVNIEPAKDQVLFEDSALPLNLFDRLCQDVYGPLKSDEKTGRKALENGGRSRSLDFNVLLAKKSMTDMISQGEMCSLADNSIVPSLDTPTAEAMRPHTQSYDVINTPVQPTSLSTSVNPRSLPDTDVDDDLDMSSSHIRNPFILAKLNTRVRLQEISSIHPKLDIKRAGKPFISPESSFTTDVQTSKVSSLPSPSISPERNAPYQNPEPPNRPWRNRREQADENEDESPTLSGIPQKGSHEQTILPQKRSSIGEPPIPLFKAIAKNSSSLMNGVGNIQLPPDERINATEDVVTWRTPNTKFRPPTAFEARKLSPTTPDAPQSRMHRSSRTGTHSSFPPSPADTITRTIPPRNQPNLLRDESAAELNDIMHFENAKRDTIQRHRGQNMSARHKNGTKEKGPGLEVAQRNDEAVIEDCADRSPTANSDRHLHFRSAKVVDNDIPEQPNSASYTQNPHWNRRNKALRDLERRRLEAEPTPSRMHHPGVSKRDEGELNLIQSQLTPDLLKMSPRDPRAYLIRNIDDPTADDPFKKQSRGILAKLPFEKSIPGTATFMLVAKIGTTATMPEDILKVRASTTQVANSDLYIRSGKMLAGLHKSKPPPSTLKTWETTCRRLLETYFTSQGFATGTTVQTSPEFDIDLAAIWMENDD